MRLLIATAALVVATAVTAAAQPPAHSAARQSAATLLTEGIALLKANRAADAAAKFSEAVRLDPSLPEAHYYVGMTMPTVADTLGIPLGTAQSRLNRALTGLRRAMGRPAAPATPIAHEGQVA